ncbi:MAG: nuclear transport factor 2 family protein [Kofleriaceae bacterium]
MPEAGTEQETAPPPRFLLRPAGVLTQLLCAFALLLGTISVILVQQNKTGGIALVIVWAVAAMAGVVFGGLMARGGMLSVVASALIVGAFGAVLLVIDWDALRSLLRLLPEDDVLMIADILVAVAVAMIATSVLSFVSIPQARAYNRALREAEAEAEKSGFFQAQASGALPKQVQVPITLPGRATRTMSVQPDPALMATERAPDPSSYAPPGYASPGGTYPPQGGFAPSPGGTYPPRGGPPPGGTYPPQVGTSPSPGGPYPPQVGSGPSSGGTYPPQGGAVGSPSGSFGPPQGGSFGPPGVDPVIDPAIVPRRRTAPSAVAPMPTAPAPGMAFRAGAGSSIAHTSAMAPHPGTPQSPALAPAYRDASTPAYGNANTTLPYAPHAHDGPPSMPPHASPAPHDRPSTPYGHDHPPSMPAPLHASAEPPTAPLNALPGSLGTRRDGAPSMPPPMGAAPGRVSDRNLPLPPPPPSYDGYAQPPDVQFAGDVPSSHSTAPGWAPSPARTYTTMMLVTPPKVEQRSRRRVYMILGGFAIGLGAGVGVLVSSMQDEKREAIATASSTTSGPTTSGSSGTTSGSSAIDVGTNAGSSAIANAGSATDLGALADAGAPIDAAPPPPIHNFLDAQRAAIGVGDLAKLAQTLTPTAFAVGIDADDLAEGRDAIEAMLTKNLGDPPPDGFKVSSKFLSIGQEGAYAWTAEELELSGPDIAPRRLVITQALVAADGAWSVVALCWAQTVRDETAERLAILGTLPQPRAIVDKIEGDELGQAAKAAFASRKAFADARSERDDGFNFGSGPGERIVGGARIKSLFSRLRAELRLDGGVRAVTAGTFGVAALNAVYTAKGRAATDVSQTFRVLVVFLQEGTAWKIVQTQFSNAGPISE